MKNVHVARKITISLPKEDVFQYVRQLKNQNDYSVNNQRDPNLEVNYVGSDGNEGFVFTWDSKNRKVGRGSQQIIRIIENQTVESELQFIKPRKKAVRASLKLKSISTKETEVVFELSRLIKFPLSLFKRSLEQSISNELQQNLENLKKRLEA